MAVALVPLLVVSLASFRWGVGLDQDGQEILNVIDVLRTGGYEASRTSGFPLYEYLAAAVVNPDAIKALSLVFTLSALVVLALLVKPARSWMGLFAWATYALLPGTVANATSVIEAPLFGLLVLVMLYLLLETQSRWWLAVVAALIVLTRPDGSLLVAATAGAFAVWRRPRRAAVPLLMGVGAAAVAILLLNRGVPETGLLTEPLLRTFARAAVSVSTALNGIGIVGLVVLVLALVMQWRSPDPDVAFYSRWLLVVLLVVGVRFGMLPDELDYLVGAILVLLTLIPRIAGGQVARAGAAIVMVGLVSTSLLTFPLFQRDDPWAPAPTFAPGISSSGIVQDYQARRAETIRNTSQYQAYFQPADGALLLPQEMWYQVFAPRFAATYASYPALEGCAGLTSRSEPPGWRLSQPAGVFEDVQIFLDREPVTCSVVAVNGPDGWTVLPAAASD